MGPRRARSSSTTGRAVAAAGHPFMLSPVIPVTVDARIHFVCGPRRVRPRPSWVSAVGVRVRLEHLGRRRAGVSFDGDDARDAFGGFAGDGVPHVAFVAESVGEGGVDVRLFGVDVAAAVCRDVGGGPGVSCTAHVAVYSRVGFVSDIGGMRSSGRRCRSGGAAVSGSVIARSSVVKVAIHPGISLVGDVASVRACSRGGRTGRSVMGRETTTATHVAVDARVRLVGNVACMRTGSAVRRASSPVVARDARGGAAGMAEVGGAGDGSGGAVAIDSGVHFVCDVAGMGTGGDAGAIGAVRAGGAVQRVARGMTKTACRAVRASRGSWALTEGVARAGGVVGGIINGVKHRHVEM